MRHLKYGILTIALVCSLCCERNAHAESPTNSIAFASFAPLNTDLMVANADGSNPIPLVPHSSLDYNASYSQDGKWVIFTSERNGSADIYRVHPDGGSLEQLTDHKSFDDQAALSPDGTLLSFVSSRSGHAQIWILDIHTRGLRRLTNHDGADFRPSWSPDGEWIAFSSDRDSRRPRGRPASFVTRHSTELYVIRKDGSDFRRLTESEAFAGSPSWSPDGTQIAFYQAELDEVGRIASPRRGRFGTTQIATINVATGERRLATSGEGEKLSPQWLSNERIAFASGRPNRGVDFTSGPAGTRGDVRSPSWSPDGARMVFHREVEDTWPPHRRWHSSDSRYHLIRTGIFASYSPTGEELVLNDGTAGAVHNNILKMHADGSKKSVLLADEKRSVLAPEWSPSGNRIAFGYGHFFPAGSGAAKSATATIAVINTDGSGLRQLTDSKENAGFPSWSPDETHIAYRRFGGNKNTLMVLEVETGRTRALTIDLENLGSPKWSPSGKLIVFSGRRRVTEDYDVYTIKPDGSELRQLTDSQGNDSHPSWSADGEWITFTSARGGFKDEAALHPYNPQPYSEIYAMRVDGSDVRMLTDNQFEDGIPSWVPKADK